MKKISPPLIGLLLFVTLAQAQKTNPSKQFNKGNIAANQVISTGGVTSLVGSWSGILTNDNGVYPQNFAFKLTDRNEFIMATANGVIGSQGTYSFSNNIFKASYKQFSSSETFSISGTYDAATKKLICTQGSGTNITGQGKFSVSMVGAPVMTINSNNINTTIKPGVKGIPPPVAVTTTPPQNTIPGSNYGTTMWNENTDLNEYYLTKAILNIYSGNDSKERPSCVTHNLYTNSKSYYATQNNTSTTNLIGSIACSPAKVSEYPANTKTTLPLNLFFNAWDGTRGDYRPSEISLTTFSKNGLTLEIIYSANFFADAWKIDKVELTVEFKKPDGTPHQYLGNKTITFSKSALLTESNTTLKLVTDKFMFPIN